MPYLIDHMSLCPRIIMATPKDLWRLGALDVTLGLELPLRYMHGISNKHITRPNRLGAGQMVATNSRANANTRLRLDVSNSDKTGRWSVSPLRRK